MAIRLSHSGSRLSRLSDDDVFYPVPTHGSSTADQLSKELVHSPQVARRSPAAHAIERKALALLNDLLALEPNWDSYQAPRVLPNIAVYALHIVRALTSGVGLPLPHINPMASGGIQLAWYRQGLDLEIDIHPDGADFYYADHSNGEEWFGDFSDPKIVEFIGAAKRQLQQE